MKYVKFKTSRIKQEWMRFEGVYEQSYIFWTCDESRPSLYVFKAEGLVRFITKGYVIKLL